jgi:dihydroxy-acid dehydratase
MGALSADVPSIVMPGGPMNRTSWHGEQLASGTDVWRFWAERGAGRMSCEAWCELEDHIAASPGHCMTMGTASTMASMVEALGITLPGNAAWPAVDARRARLARLSGRRIVEMVRDNLTLSQILTLKAFENAIKVNGAIGGSTNAVIHLLAIAGRIGVELTLDTWDRVGRDVPTVVDLMPSGRFLMEELAYAGGIPAVMKRIEHLLHLDVMTVTGTTLRERLKVAEIFNEDVVRPLSNPLVEQGGIRVLRGNLAPKGAVVKPSAATPALMQHRGKALVFDDIDDFKARIDDPGLDVEASTVLVLRNCGPKGYPGMAEVGNMSLPKKLLEQGVRDMVRISDARMSGTAYGTVVLHVAPEAAAGGPLALVRTGDEIRLDVPAGRLELLISEEELESRAAEWAPQARNYRGGYESLYVAHVQGADVGADLDFLVGRRGADVPRESH